MKGNTISSTCSCSSTSALLLASFCGLYLLVFTGIHSSSFYYTHTAITVHVTLPTQQTTDIVVFVDDTVLSVKEKLAEITHIPVHHQRLVFLHRTLEDSRLLSEYHIQRGSSLHLAEAITNNSAVRMFMYKQNQRNCTILHVYPHETVLVLQQKVKDIVGSRMCKMRLIYQDRSISDFSRLAELHLSAWLTYELVVVPVCDFCSTQGQGLEEVELRLGAL